jgi:serine/threonine protein kinase
MKSFASAGHPVVGTETSITDNNLKLVIDNIARIAKMKCNRGVDKISLISSSLSSERTNQEYYIHNLINGAVYITSEAKGLDASGLVCIPQALQAAADAAISFYYCGMSTEDTAVPGLIHYGDVFQVYGVYLLEPCFPVITFLSDKLECTTSTGRELLAKWMIVLAHYAKETYGIGDFSQSARRAGAVGAILSLKGKFLKPVRCEIDVKKSPHNYGYVTEEQDQRVSSTPSTGMLEVNHIMYCYDRLFGRQDSELFLFPEGVLCLPHPSIPNSKSIYNAMVDMLSKDFPSSCYSDFPLPASPLLVYERLDPTSWTSLKPCTPEDMADYKALLARAVRALNYAGLAHLDLRPQNILYCREYKCAIECADDCVERIMWEEPPSKMKKKEHDTVGENVAAAAAGRNDTDIAELAVDTTATTHIAPSGCNSTATASSSRTTTTSALTTATATISTTARGVMKMKIIDFEMVCEFGKEIPKDVVRKLAFCPYGRYPFLPNQTEESVVVTASEIHNNWFLTTVSDWVSHPVYSNNNGGSSSSSCSTNSCNMARIEGYDEFMQQHCDNYRAMMMREMLDASAEMLLV